MKYQYWIIKTYNKKRKKVLYRSRDYKKCKKNYINLIEKSKKVTVPKKILNRNGLIPVRIELLLITDDPALEKHSLSNKKIISKDKEWFVVDARAYQEEEKFFCYPERKTIEYNDILNFLKKKPSTYSIYLYFNKIIIDSALIVEKAIVFKTMGEAAAVYNKLISEELNILFLGRLNKNKRKILKDKIMKGTGIAYINLSNKKSIH